MGIDLLRAGGRLESRSRETPKTENVYIGLLAKLYKFLARRTGAPFNQVVYNRLCTTQINRPVVSMRQIVKLSKGQEDKILVIVGTVSDDTRVETIPALKVCALRFTATAKARIIKNGGEVITFDQLALRVPTGTNTMLIRGPKNSREAVKHFGIPGSPHSHAKPYVNSKGRKFERARGRRKTFHV